MRAIALIATAVIALAFVWLKAGTTAAPAVVPPAAIAPAAQNAASPVVEKSPAYWNSFRGSTFGVSDFANAPIAWDGKSGSGVLWKATLKLAGVGSPILWGDRLFITEGTEEERAVVAFDAASGKQLWRKAVPDGGKNLPLPSYSDSGLALTTPVCDSTGVYALFGTGDLAAFSHDGTPIWQIFFKRPVIGYGFSSSPCILNGQICVQIDDHNGGQVTAVDCATGKINWTVERSRGASWSSAMAVPGPGNKPLVVVNANGSITAYDAMGKMAWDADGVTGEVTPTPTWWNGKIYLVHNGSGLICYDVTGEPKKLWEYNGTLCDVASPVIANGLVFMALGSGILTCVDALTGKEVWNHEGPGCYASLVSSGDRVYCLGRDGTTLILAAERSFRSIATCKLGEGSDSTPALSNGRIYIRTRKNLWCIGAK